MAKLSRIDAKTHAEAMRLLAQPSLSFDERVFVLENFQEGANHVNGQAGAFFTPSGLAADFTIDAAGGSVIDLCAGIGGLAFWMLHRGCARGRLVCVEVNSEYVAIGRKILPEAEWFHADIFNLPAVLGHFDVAISNPPFGKVSRTGAAPRYTGAAFEYHAIDIASDLADYGAFIIPGGSAPFRYSGAPYYCESKSDGYRKFNDQTGIELTAGCGIDTSVYREGWHGVSPVVEVVCADFAEARELRRNRPGVSADLFAAAA